MVSRMKCEFCPNPATMNAIDKHYHLIYCICRQCFKDLEESMGFEPVETKEK